MRAYIKLLRQKFYIGFLIVLGCACLGAIRGAWKEDRESYINVTQYDIEMMQEPDAKMPDLTGIIGLAAEQNRWSNFDYAFIYAKRGLLSYCFLMALYLLVYECGICKAFRGFLEKGAGEETLFIPNTKKSG